MTSAGKFTIPERGSDLIETTPCSDVTFHFHTSEIFKLDHKNVESKDVHTVCMWSLM